jgi:hypothetical protein
MNMVADSSTSIRTAVAETYRETLSAEENIDQFLDFLNEAKLRYSTLSSHWHGLNLKIESFISANSSIDDLTFILVSLEGLINRANSLVSKVKAHAQYYQGIKSLIDSLEDNIDISKELCEDIKIKTDTHIIELGNQLDSL